MKIIQFLSFSILFTTSFELIIVIGNPVPGTVVAPT